MARISSVVKLEAEDYVQEYLRCKKDFDYFTMNYVYLEIAGGDILFQPYKKQTELVNLVMKENFVLVLKSRQIGISTIMKAFIAWLTLFHDNVVVGIISKDAPEATDFARDIIRMIEKIPKWMKPEFSKCTERTFILENGSKCYASPVVPNAPEKTLRGKAVTFLVIDEAAFIKHIDTAWTALVPALSTAQMHARKQGVPFGTVLLSTPNRAVGVGAWFFKKYTSAVSRESRSFKDFIIHWKDIEELANDPHWYQNICDLFENDLRKIEQELELKFLATEGSFFDEQTSSKLQDCYKVPVEKFRIFNGECWMWQEPIENKHYIIGVDTAPEHGEDKSAIVVFDYETMEQVWEFQGKLPVMDFIKIVNLACTKYQGSLVVESNSYGNQVVESMDRSEFAHMLYKEKRGVDTIVPGLSTNAKTRPLMIDSLYSMVTEFPDIIKSQRLSLELIGLVSKPSGKVEADIDCHDDLALATSLCTFVRKYDPPLMIDTKYSHMMKHKFDEIIDTNMGEYFDELNNSHIMKKIKKENISGVVDVLSYYDFSKGVENVETKDEESETKPTARIIRSTDGPKNSNQT